MTSPYQLPLLATWRKVWGEDTETMRAADELARRRNAMKAPGTRTLEFHSLGALTRLLASRRRSDLEAGTDTLDPDIPRILLLLDGMLGPLRAPRWGELERALSLLLVNGELVPAALILRTMLNEVALDEEVKRLREALPVDSEGAELSARATEDLRRLADLWIHHILPSTPGKAEIPRPSDPQDAELGRAYAALNDYVHPNYGSHVACLFPEESSVGEVLLHGFRMIYTRWMQLPWAPDATLPAQSPRPTTAASERDRFLREVLPGMATDLGEYEPTWIARVAEVQDQWSQEGPSGEGVAALERLVADGLREVLRRLTESEQTAPATLESVTGLGFPTADGLVGLAVTRQAAERLDDALREESSTTPRLAALVHTVELSLFTAEEKARGMARAIVRLVNAGHGLAAVITARSILEHMAVQRCLNVRGLERLAPARMGSVDGSEAVLGSLEQELAAFLVGTRGTRERARELRRRWAGADLSMKLRQATERWLSPEEHTLHEACCDVVHLRTWTGGDFWIDPTTSARGLAWAVMALLLWKHSELDDLFNTAAMRIGLGSAQAPDEQTADVSATDLRAFGVVEGRGTWDDPLVMRSSDPGEDLVRLSRSLGGIDGAGLEPWVPPGGLDRGMGLRLALQDGSVLYVIEEVGA